jgi:hypothetical protein
MPEPLPSYPPRQIGPCTICGLPTNLYDDPYTDDNGKPVHEMCYLKKLTGLSESPHSEPGG